MFKKLLSWISKKTKITRKLTYVYRGLLIAENTLNSIIDLIDDATKLSDDKIEKIRKICEYLTAAKSALESILRWAGIEIEETYARSQDSIEHITELLNETND